MSICNQSLLPSKDSQNVYGTNKITILWKASWSQLWWSNMLLPGEKREMQLWNLMQYLICNCKKWGPQRKFPEILTLCWLFPSVAKATAERSFSQMKTRLCNRLSDGNLPRLMWIAIEGPEFILMKFWTYLSNEASHWPLMINLLLRLRYSVCSLIIHEFFVSWFLCHSQLL